MNKTIEGRYANHFDVGHNAFEFVIDCGQCFPENLDVVIRHTRIITNPVYAAALLQVLAEGLKSYREKYGEIPEIELGSPSNRNMLC
ncbi:MAG: DUF3467 domain-containing protein [Deltaproteobacteria bacterium]|nr:DUF3467 domain-containing protein [Deltaproteobacteria bacterium]